MELRDRQFLLGFIPQIRTIVSSISDGVVSELKKTHKVSVDGEVSVKGDFKDKDLLRAIKELKTSIEKPSKIDGVVKTEGEVSISGLIEAISSLESAVKESAYKGSDIQQATKVVEEIKKAVSAIKIPAPKITIPKQDAPVVNIPAVSMPKSIGVEGIDSVIIILNNLLAEMRDFKGFTSGSKSEKIDLSPLKEAVLELKTEISRIPQQSEPMKFPEVLPVHIIGTEVVQKTPQPVTNININGLRGPVKSTAVSVSTPATKLPATNLENRRSLIVYNNSNSATLYIGGSDVTTANGLPIFQQSYSPPIDLSDRVNLYGISTGTVDVRVLEASMDDIGS